MTNPKTFKFEAALKELEAITNWFESADINLDAGLEKFERGMELSKKSNFDIIQMTKTPLLIPGLMIAQLICLISANVTTASRSCMFGLWH
jgi:exodeoxyribonuclease VII small subunit